MSKYYVITAGEYSSYHVVQVTMNKKLAEAYLKIHDGRPDDMYIEEYDDLIDQCDIQDIFNKASANHPYVCIQMNKRGEIYSDGFLREKLMHKNSNDFCWREGPPKEPTLNGHSIYANFEMWVQVDKYNYDFDKIAKAVTDTRAKMMAERERL